jgi:hypothetical protein
MEGVTQMGSTRGARDRRGLAAALAGALFVAVLAWAVPAFAATIDIGGTAVESKCNPCHANIADTKPGSEIKFSHAYHMTYACSACHTQFPHQPQGTVTPKMSDCFGCHNLRHGPQGKLAKGDCEVCHNTPRTQLRPDANALSAPNHVANWAQKPHVAPSLAGQNTVCMMCHDGPFCDNCHIQKGVTWRPTTPYAFDSQQSCMVCHGQTNLTKLTIGGTFQSFQVLGIQQSAHTKFSCQACHVDFRYSDTKYTYSDGTIETKLWQVNAGLGCRDCHEGKIASFVTKVAPFGKVVAEYDSSIHRQLIAKAQSGQAGGNFEAATCASCHGGHDIQRLDTTAARAAFHLKAEQVCGGASCHAARYASYNDYYHGAAYKKGAPDAPACWDCHGSHAILPVAQKASLMSAENMARTCGKCHPGSQESFSAGAQTLIHQKADVQNANFLQKIVSKVKSFFSFL